MHLFTPIPTTAPTKEQRKVLRKQRRDRARIMRRLLALLLLAVPLVVLIIKYSGTPTGLWLQKKLSLVWSSKNYEARTAHVLLVPLGAMLAVFFRLTLGIRVLGPFRSVLLAIAFQATGILPGLVFLIVALGTVTLTRPIIKALRLTSYARLSVTLSLVALMIVLSMMLGRHLHYKTMIRSVYFPIVVLSLMADGFAATLRKEGTRSALWRGASTALLGVIICLVAEHDGFQRLLLRYPELLLAEVGLMLVISEYFAFRWFKRWNPPPARRRRAKRSPEPATPAAAD